MPVAAGNNIVLDSAASAARRLNSTQQSHSPRKTPQLRPSPTISQHTAAASEPPAGSPDVEMQHPAASKALAGSTATDAQPTAAAATANQGQPQLDAEERSKSPEEHVDGQQVRQTDPSLNFGDNPGLESGNGQVKRCLPW